MQKRTKIVITLGPATNDEVVLGSLLDAGIDLVRINFSHGTLADRKQQVELLNKVAIAKQKTIGVLADLQGPKIRIAEFAEQKVELVVGQEFKLDLNCPVDAGDNNRVNVDYPQLFADIKVGQTLCLDDGKITLQVTKVQPKVVSTQVVNAGILSSNKGINLVGGGLSARTLTEKDKADLAAACQLGVNYIALSFVKDVQDIDLARRLLKDHNSKVKIITKIERAEALEDLDAIINASDGVMVARGDLAIEVGDAEVPAIQKNIVHIAKQYAKPVIVATQMMESMIVNPIPTRAEMSDVANAVLDGADAVMLSAESAVGEYPVLAVEAMVRACVSAEKHRSLQFKTIVPSKISKVDEAIAMATIYTANRLRIKAIVALTESGKTPLWMSSLQSSIPICAFSRHAHTLGLMSLYRGVLPVAFDVTSINKKTIDQHIVNALILQNMVQLNDLIIITRGEHLGVRGGSNAMKIVTVSEEHYE